jgi:hypothetical protein
MTTVLGGKRVPNKGDEHPLFLKPFGSGIITAAVCGDTLVAFAVT